MERGWLNLPYLAWAVICLALALLWAFVWPHERAAGAAPLRLFLVRWGHTITWGLLAAMCLLRATGQPAVAGLGNLVGMLALPVYLAFLAATFVLR
ncbi:MAG TPA: hypothetical protein PKD53_33190 [Chloroflexaceae bacterium]|nr:hypothetical protein [Chloroflexaceae bacterium]